MENICKYCGQHYLKPTIDMTKYYDISLKIDYAEGSLMMIRVDWCRYFDFACEDIKSTCDNIRGLL